MTRDFREPRSTPTATIEIRTRLRRIRIAIALVRIAGLIGSVRLARRAVALIRAEYQVGRSSTWHPLDLQLDERLRIERRR